MYPVGELDGVEDFIAFEETVHYSSDRPIPILPADISPCLWVQISPLKAGSVIYVVDRFVDGHKETHSALPILKVDDLAKAVFVKGPHEAAGLWDPR